MHGADIENFKNHYLHWKWINKFIRLRRSLYGIMKLTILIDGYEVEIPVRSGRGHEQGCDGFVRLPVESWLEEVGTFLEYFIGGGHQLEALMFLVLEHI